MYETASVLEHNLLRRVPAGYQERNERGYAIVTPYTHLECTDIIGQSVHIDEHNNRRRTGL